MSKSKIIDKPKITTEMVKKITSSDFHPMLKALSSEDFNGIQVIAISDLPIAVQKEAEKVYGIHVPKVTQLSKNDMDLISAATSNIGSPRKIQESLKVMETNRLNDVAKHTRRKSIMNKFESHPSLMPSTINSVKKIVEKCKPNLDTSLLDSISYIPQRSLKLDNLPTKVLEVLETKKFINMPQGIGDVVLEYKSNLDDAKSVRLTNNSISESAEKSSVKLDQKTENSALPNIKLGLLDQTTGKHHLCY